MSPRRRTGRKLSGRAQTAGTCGWTVSTPPRSGHRAKAHDLSTKGPNRCGGYGKSCQPKPSRAKAARSSVTRRGQALARACAMRWARTPSAPYASAASFRQRARSRIALEGLGSAEAAQPERQKKVREAQTPSRLRCGERAILERFAQSGTMFPISRLRERVGVRALALRSEFAAAALRLEDTMPSSSRGDGARSQFSTGGDTGRGRGAERRDARAAAHWRAHRAQRRASARLQTRACMAPRARDAA